MIRILTILFASFFKIGLFTIGGGLVVVPLIRAEMIARGWLTDAQFLDILALAQATPGPVGVNTATFVGFRVPEMQGFGTWNALLGALVASIAVVLPSVVCVFFFGRWFERNREKRWMKTAFLFIRPAVSLFVVWAGVKLSLDCFPSLPAVTPVSAAVFAFAAASVFFRRVSPLWPLLAGAMLGALA